MRKDVVQIQLVIEEPMEAELVPVEEPVFEPNVDFTVSFDVGTRDEA
jgi:hypothetical protein